MLDANVLVSGIFWAGLPARLLQHWLEGSIELIASATIMAEYQRVLEEIAGSRGRMDLARRWNLALSANVTLIDVRPVLKVCRDPDDNKYLDCAVQGNAARVVSGDKDLLSLAFIGPIPIVSARKALSDLVVT